MTLDAIQRSLKERGVRLTRQRQILLGLIDKTGAHLERRAVVRVGQGKRPED